MAGLAFFACANKSRTREAPTPTNISTKSEPEMLKNGTPASPATARASKVLPVPGGPTNKHPRGIFAPIALYLSGLLKKSLISFISSTASSTPATSANVTSGRSSCALRAFVFPKLSCELVERFICTKKKIISPASNKIGRMLLNVSRKVEGNFTSNVMFGWLLNSSINESCPM